MAEEVAKFTIEGVHGPHRIYVRPDHLRITFYPVVRHARHMKVPLNTSGACLRLICEAYDMGVGDFGRHLRALLDKTDPQGENDETNS